MALLCAAAGQATAAQADDVRQVAVFEVCELTLEPPSEFTAASMLPETQIHDAYDADRDGRFLRCDVTFSKRTASEAVAVTVCAFAMRDKPAGAWRFCVRWSPRSDGDWKADATWDGCFARGGAAVRARVAVPTILRARIDARITGPLVAPGPGDTPGFLRQLRAGDTSRAIRLFGACRAWVAGTPAATDPWGEWIDRDTELFPAMRDGGFNLLNQWMAPWEFLLVHHDRGEHWRSAEGWTRIARASGCEWSSFQCYDQGRARAFDDLVRQCEGGSTDPAAPPEAVVHLLLSPLPHQCLQMRAHPWGGQESGWSPLDDANMQGREKLNGFSGFMSQMSAWDFFAADPRRPLEDWQCRLFDHQANFYRYVIARWSASRAIGAWVLIDELDGVGDEAGDRSRSRGWWAHPDCERWLADASRLIRGTLARSDDLAYPGDPFAHPWHAATTSFGDEAMRGGNIDWDGGPEGSRPDLYGFHFYPHWRNLNTLTEAWTATIDGIASYAHSPIGSAPRVISEYGAGDRAKPDQMPNALYPTLYHHGIWSAIFSGHSGTPMDWDDGKEFGELRPRARAGAFDRNHYPIDLVAQMQALQRFLEGCPPDRFASCRLGGAAVRCRPEADERAFALYATSGTAEVRGWLFAGSGRGAALLDGLPTGDYQLTWFDPWTGRPISDLDPLSVAVSEDHTMRIDASTPLKRLAELGKPFPQESRLAVGQDVAFVVKRR
ncbi:MAG: hypothetical protein H0V44_15655 [Planctomycetes bacterium]|nr:hypothetical protein [Planctomycetota bacterium]